MHYIFLANKFEMIFVMIKVEVSTKSDINVQNNNVDIAKCQSITLILLTAKPCLSFDLKYTEKIFAE